MVIPQYILHALGIAAGTGIFLYLIKRCTKKQTPLPNFDALVDIKRGGGLGRRMGTIETPKTRIPTRPELEAYSEKYKQYYTEPTAQLSEAEIADALAAERKIHADFLNKEIASIDALIDTTCEKIGLTRAQIRSNIKALHGAHHSAWELIHEKFTTETMTTTAQINEVLLEFEENFFNKAYASISANDAAAAPAPSPPPDDFTLDDVYDDGEDVTALVPQTPPLEVRVAEYIAADKDFLYIQFYMYNLQIDVLLGKIAAIMRGERDADYIADATEKFLKTKYSRLRNAIVMEHTPVGNVCMYYNGDTASFEYYADCTVPYPLLETVARKYCRIYNCKELYVIVENETVNMYAADTVAERKAHVLRAANAANARATADRREQTAQQRAAIRGWGQSSSLKPVEPELKQFKRKVNNFVKKAPLAGFKPLQSVPAAQRCKKLTWSDYAKNRAPVKTIVGMEMHESMASVGDSLWSPKRQSSPRG
jgi:hypothetical protein